MNDRYPKISIRSKNELAKHISSKKLPLAEALKLINDVSANFDNYWKDSKKSEPRKRKYVRTAAGKPLNTLLKAIDKKLLQPYDKHLPDFIFGGVKGKSHISAAHHLIGKKNQRTLVKMDITRFFEQIGRDRVFYFFYKKCGCSVRASNLLADICCVPIGKKGSNNAKKTIARGFPTSSRLAVWTNLDTFLRLKWEAEKLLRGHDFRLVIFVDDIGITASRVSEQKLDNVRKKLQKILLKNDENQPLPVNRKKTKIIPFIKGAEHLGVLLGRSKITIGSKTKSKMAAVKGLIKKSVGEKRSSLVKKRLAYYQYKKQIEKISNPV